jgi:hypothetical protein
MGQEAKSQDVTPQETIRWMILPTIIAVFELLAKAFNLLGLAALKSADAGSDLLPPGLDISDPTWTRLLDYEWNTSILVISLLGVLLALQIARSWIFPGAFTAFLVLNLLLRFFHIMLANSVATLRVDAANGSYTELMRPVIYCVIWIPVYLRSKRAQLVFNRPWPMANPF